MEEWLSLGYRHDAMSGIRWWIFACRMDIMAQSEECEEQLVHPPYSWIMPSGSLNTSTDSRLS
jgi:hypothetical protein